MSQLQNQVYDFFSTSKKGLAVLIDPDKFQADQAITFIRRIPHNTTHIFIGGSSVPAGRTESCVQELRKISTLPIVLFPGDHSQITPVADAILFLSLISGRNPDYLIGQQVQAVDQLRDAQLEIIPTGYILVDGGKECAVQKVSKTFPLSQQNPNQIVRTALAGEYSGKKMIYLEAGSGALVPVQPNIVRLVKQAISIPLVVGGGIRSKTQLEAIYGAGADLVVIGTAFEEGQFFLPKGNSSLKPV